MNDWACNCGMGGGHSHDSSLDDESTTNLRSYIDMSSVHALNESEAGSCKLVFKDYKSRNQPLPNMKSNEDDPELILHVPFTQAVKVQSVCISGGLGGKAPTEAKVWVDRDDIDFSNAEDLPPAQTLSLVDPDQHLQFGAGSLDYPLRASKFQAASSLTFFFPDSFGGDRTVITYVGFKGIAMNMRRGVVDAVYEARPV
eukprot:CAMPEP_0197570766 /NCGR_PEP_ID=MMETSP1320-20131121/41292_1 /TAXON_ID=91990 /ORGANISM="Bolidomonas sp., Strain RCC2347" /LENGTH=198 /DNA_ID=CAMNT_0043133219 /DNA_START=118 /DNA_END=710 /DNA_ORIENTATION=-